MKSTLGIKQTHTHKTGTKRKHQKAASDVGRKCERKERKYCFLSHFMPFDRFFCVLRSIKNNILIFIRMFFKSNFSGVESFPLPPRSSLYPAAIFCLLSILCLFLFFRLLSICCKPNLSLNINEMIFVREEKPSRNFFL